MSELNTEKLWIFGYGSLCWNVGCKYTDAQLGFVRGFKRRFYQGNNTHRGNEKKPGRVVTLIEDENQVTWGKAFLLDDEKVSKSYLDTREIQLGGYTTVQTTFEPLDKNIKPFPVLIYIALENNDQYLGKASCFHIAKDIITSEGEAGHNLEYLANLAKFMRDYLPDVEDTHLYSLEQMCIYILDKIKSPLLNKYFDTNLVEEKWHKTIQHELEIHCTESMLCACDLSEDEGFDTGESTSCSSDDDDTSIENSSDHLYFARKSTRNDDCLTRRVQKIINDSYTFGLVQRSREISFCDYNQSVL